MKTITAGLILVTILTGCVMPESNRAVYEEKARHVEKIYNAPFDKLQVCLTENSWPTVYGGYVLRNEAFYGIKGVFEVWLYEISGDRTKAKVSGKPGHFDTKPEKWIRIMDKCEAELRGKS